MNLLKVLLETARTIKKNKLIFIALILVQIIFLFSLFFVVITYSPKILNNAKEIADPFQNLDYNSLNLTEKEVDNPLMKEMIKSSLASIKKGQEMIKNILEMIFLALACFLVFNGFSWSLANYLVKKSSLWQYWGKFAVTTALFLAPTSLIVYFVFKSLVFSLDPSQFQLWVNLFSGFLLVVSYFMLISYCLADEKLKDLIKKIFIIGFKKSPQLLLSLLILFILIFLSLVLVYFSMDRHLVLMILSGLAFIAVLAFGKIYLIETIAKLKTKND